MKKIEELAKEIFGLKSALIFCHTRPDGDTLGSAGALCFALRDRGIECDIVCDSDIPEKFLFINEFKCILGPAEVVGKYDGHIAVDIATEGLFGYAWGAFACGRNKFSIDHHMSNDLHLENGYVKNLASNTMNIYDLLTAAGVKITPDIATCILLGIITDTNNFSNDNTDASALFYAGRMIEAGAGRREINYYIYKNQAKERAFVYLDTMKKMRFYLSDRLSLIVIEKSVLASYGLSGLDTEGFVDFPLSVRGVEVAVSLLEVKNNQYKVSFRSKGRVNVNAVAGMFGGGGHILASGCVVTGPLEEVIEKIVRAVDVNME